MKFDKFRNPYFMFRTFSHLGYINFDLFWPFLFRFSTWPLTLALLSICPLEFIENNFSGCYDGVLVWLPPLFSSYSNRFWWRLWFASRRMTVLKFCICFISWNFVHWRSVFSLFRKVHFYSLIFHLGIFFLIFFVILNLQIDFWKNRFDFVEKILIINNVEKSKTKKVFIFFIFRKCFSTF